jgi:Mg2+/citrate symporter
MKLLITQFSLTCRHFISLLPKHSPERPVLCTSQYYWPVAGPVVSALTNKFGCRTVCIAGSVIGCVAFILSTFSPSVNVLMLTYGVMGGKSVH